MKKSKFDNWSGLIRDKAANWQGGRHKAWNGYIRLLMRNHPRALSNGYVWEHIIVMEQKLGRPLKYFGKGHKNNETVHHINSDKTDNRPENLTILSPVEHSKEEWKTPLKYPQSKLSQIETPERYLDWYKKNNSRFNK